MTTPRFLQIHTLHSYPAALLNGDDSGLAKRIPSAAPSAPASPPSASSGIGELPRTSLQFTASPAAPQPCGRGISLSGR